MGATPIALALRAIAKVNLVPLDEIVLDFNVVHRIKFFVGEVALPLVVLEANLLFKDFDLLLHQLDGILKGVRGRHSQVEHRPLGILPRIVDLEKLLLAKVVANGDRVVVRAIVILLTIDEFVLFHNRIKLNGCYLISLVQS